MDNDGGQWREGVHAVFVLMDDHVLVSGRFVEKCRLLEFDEGEVLFAQGERGKRLLARVAIAS